MAILDDDFDFGFTAVDEDELEAVQAVTQQAVVSQSAADELEKKIDKLYNAIIPLLMNLKKNPEKSYIYWPNRTSKIEEFENVLKRIIES